MPKNWTGLKAGARSRDGENKTAYYRGKFRQGYGPENEVLGHKASLDSFDHRVLYLSQNNIWNWLLGIKTEQETPIRDFLSKAIKSSTTQNPNWPSLQSEGVVATFLGKVETVSTSEKSLKARYSIAYLTDAMA